MLPVLRGERFAGRIEAVRRGGALAVRAFWPEAARAIPLRSGAASRRRPSACAP